VVFAENRNRETRTACRSYAGSYGFWRGNRSKLRLNLTQIEKTKTFCPLLDSFWRNSPPYPIEAVFCTIVIKATKTAS
jgi:hypothetical protein